MRYRGNEICGENLGRHSGPPVENEGLHRVCYGRSGHLDGHGNDDWPGHAELLLTDDELDRLNRLTT